MAALERATAANDVVDVAVHHLDNPDGARRLVDRLSGRVRVGDIVISEVSACSASTSVRGPSGSWCPRGSEMALSGCSRTALSPADRLR